jgi:hypothetical protein
MRILLKNVFEGLSFIDRVTRCIERNKKEGGINMVPRDRTLEKECFITRYFLIYLNLKDMGIRGQL